MQTVRRATQAETTRAGSEPKACSTPSSAGSPPASLRTKPCLLFSVRRERMCTTSQQRRASRAGSPAVGWAAGWGALAAAVAAAGVLL